MQRYLRGVVPVCQQEAFVQPQQLPVFAQQACQHEGILDATSIPAFDTVGKVGFEEGYGTACLLLAGSLHGVEQLVFRYFFAEIAVDEGVGLFECHDDGWFRVYGFQVAPPCAEAT